MRNTKGLVGIVCSFFISFSIVTFSSTFGGQVFAEETGGYPWADALEVNSSTYDWGYPQCQPEMAQARTCSAHYGYRQGNTYHISDPWRYDVRNCTSFVAWKLFDKFNIAISSWGHAKNWDNAARKAGYNVDKKPIKHSIAVWEKGLYGHVAFVTDVNPDGSVNVEQYNRAGKGEYSRESRVKADHYIHVAPAEIVETPIIPVASPPTIQDLITKTLPVLSASLPKEKAAEAVQVTSTAFNGQLEPIKPEVKSEPVKQTTEDNVSYFVGSQPHKNKVKAYAIRHKNTKSGKIEVSSHDMETENKWSSELITPQPAAKEANYTLADYNADGTLDLYAISYGATVSGKLEVAVMDGSSNYSTYLSQSVSNINSVIKGDAWYGVADSNGDGSLDVYQVQHSNTKTGYLQVTILDGGNKFRSVLADSMVPEKNISEKDVYYMLADNNSDGKTDLFQVHHNNTNSDKLEVKVFDGSNSFAGIICKWVTDQPEYEGSGPVIE